MAFKIYPVQDICNMIGKDSVTVDTVRVQNGYITVGNFYIPLSNIMYIQEV